MDLLRWPHADDILDRALDLPPNEQRQYVQDASGGDAELAAALEAVLAEANTTDAFLAPGGALAGALAADLVARDAFEELPAGLQFGQVFGSYEVVGVLGRGGMGEVYRARDDRLGRDVALKVLPAHLAVDAGRRAKLTQEARLLASLNDPHIAAIYDIEEHEGITALVLELVEGETLADQLTRGRFSIRASLDVAEQLVHGLAAAHRRGIIHRDLKPANVKVTPDGLVKILDFGIATAVDEPQGHTWPASAETLEMHAVVLGTPSYVAPERAGGMPTDHRGDIWAFGCLLYEMLTGVRAYAGVSPADTLSKIGRDDPDFSRLPVRTPPSIARLLERCFRKDPGRRLGYIGDALLDIEDARRELSGDVTVRAPARTGRRTAALTVGALAGGLLLGAAAWSLFVPRPAGDSMAYLSVPIPGEDDLVAGELPGLAISPDGQTVVYRTRRTGVIQLVKRRLDQTDPVVLDGSSGGASPFFSPDSAWIGFATDAQLLKAPAGGGAAVAIADIPGGARASWGPDDMIWFSSGSTRVLQRIPAGGGTPAAVTTLDSAAGDVSHDGPSAMSAGRYALFTVTRGVETSIALADAASGRYRILTPGRQPTALNDRWFVFARGDGLWLAQVDVERGELVGEPVSVVAGLELGAQSGAPQYAVSASGSLIFMPRTIAGDLRSPVWVDRDGREEAIPVEARPYTRAAIAPDGARLALAVATPEERDIWVFEFARRVMMRLTLDPGTDTAPVWTPDSQAIAFRSERGGGGIYIKAADGASVARPLTHSEGPGRPAHTPYSFTPDGSTLVFAELRSYSDQGIRSVTLRDAPSVTTVLDGPFAEARPAVSPDGRLIAYQSNETGRYEVFVRPYPDVNAARAQVSVHGGTSPRWSPDGSELFFFDGASLSTATLRTRSPLTFAAPTALFDASRFDDRLGPVYDVARDGRRFLFLRQAGPDGGPVRRGALNIITNWRHPGPDTQHP